jgi:general secretion pathway protein A
MYTDHYHLKKMPFTIAIDSQLTWVGPKHAQALHKFKEAFQENKNFFVLTGDAGTGKTTLMKRFLEELDENTRVAIVPDPSLTLADFIDYLSAEIGLDKYAKSAAESLPGLECFLNEVGADNKRVLIAIDEGHHISQDLIFLVRDLLDISFNGKHLMGVMLVGPERMGEILEPFKEGIFKLPDAVRYHLDPLTEDETRQYIRYRLEASGASKEIFSADAEREIYSFSSGYPITINIICDRALLTGYVKGLTVIDEVVVRECAKELPNPGPTV